MSGAGFNDDDLTLSVVLLTKPGQKITKSALQQFRTNTLENDDIFQSDFCANVVFYGSEKQRLQIDADALDELEAWNSKTSTFLAGDSGVKAAPGPYVFTQAKTWQPWRVYYDFNCTLMTAFKPHPDANGR